MKLIPLFKLGTHRIFAASVLFPTLVAVLYFGLFASDIYVSESKFVVRSPEKQSSSPLGVLLKGSSFTRAQDDSYTVQDYMLSRDALYQLDTKLNVKGAFSKGDIFSRFPGLDWDDSMENMHRYYQKMVGVQVDSSSSIGTLTVRAFDAADAKSINEQLLLRAEELVNKLNERGRQDMIRFASQEVSVAEEKAKAAALALASYRNQKGVIDPEKQSAIPFQQIAKLQDELISSKTQLAQLQFSASNNPQIPVLRQKIQMLEGEIDAESQKIAGSGRSLASKAVDFQRLALDKEFADKQLAAALASLEQARNDARRQQLYLERIAQPSLPDAAMEPRRLRGVFATLLTGLVAWGILAMIFAGVREHMD
ncbi:hypothetical protein [Zoogloea sp.]|uniref:hypothetical protein n=1 Tax=Zoogloea sp. TaxID=49181 RepID=UPI0035AE6A4B